MYDYNQASIVHTTVFWRKSMLGCVSTAKSRLILTYIYTITIQSAEYIDIYTSSKSSKGSLNNFFRR